MKLIIALLNWLGLNRLIGRNSTTAGFGAEENAKVLALQKSSGSSGFLNVGDGESQDCPRHVAIIMDGNNRWAKQRPGQISGHRAGVEAIRDVLRGCESHGIEVLTLFAFSSENWLRPEKEVKELMSLFESYLQNEVRELHKQGIQLRFIGRRDRLEPSLVKKMQQVEELTQTNTERVLVLAVDYGGRWDIAQACRKAIEQAEAEGISAQFGEEDFARYLSLADLPEPDLCIRTGGEYRISNFLLWQFSYTELYFTDCYWPDFDQQELDKAVDTFAGRQRRFGRTTEQVANQSELNIVASEPVRSVKSSQHA